MVLATNLTESSSLWDAATDYVAGDTAHQDDTHRRYVALASNAGAKPSENCTGVSPKWSDEAVCNDWAPFDNAINTSAIASNATIDITLDSSRCDAVAVFGLLNASSVSLEMRDGPGSIVYSENIELLNTEITNWYEYFFSEFSYGHDFVRSLPMYGQSSLRIIINGVGELLPSVGTIVIGQAHEIGNVVYDSEYGFVDWSTDEEDKWGQADLEPGNVAKTADVDVEIDTADFDRVVRLVESVRGRLAVYDCNNIGQRNRIYERAIILGRVRSFKPPIQGPVVTTFTLEIRGVP